MTRYSVEPIGNSCRTSYTTRLSSRPIQFKHATLGKHWSTFMMRILVCLSLTFSAGCGSLDRQYVEADAANYRTLAPRVSAMVDETQLYDDDQKQDIRDRLVAWELRLKKAQENLASE